MILENKFELYISYLKLLILPVLLGMPLLLIFGTDQFVNALGIDHHIQMELICLFLLLAVFAFKKVKLSRDVLVFFILPLISYIYAKDNVLALHHYGYFFVYLLLYIIFYRYQKTMLIYKTIAWLSVLLALYVLFQITSVFPYLLNNNTLQPEFKAVIQQHRQISTFYLPNAYAAFSLCAIFLSAFIFKKEHKIIYGIITFINVVMLISTITFIAYVLLGSYIVYVLLKKRLWKFILIFLFAGIGLFLWIRPQESLLSSLKYRKYNIQSAYGVYKDNPILGVGTNNFDLYYPLYKQKDSNYIHEAHSMIMQNLADHGVLGIIIIILFIKILLSVKYSPLFPMFILLSIYFAVDLLYYVPAIGGLFWLLVAVNQTDENSEKNVYVPKLLMIIVVLGYLSFTIIQHYYTPISYIETEKQQIQSDYNNGLYYSSWVRSIELKDYYEQSETN